MQKVVYTCDCGCGKVIGAKPHISLVMQLHHQGNGIALPPKHEGNPHKSGWGVVGFDQSFVHFINEEHIARYFKRKLEIATKGMESDRGKRKR